MNEINVIINITIESSPDLEHMCGRTEKPILYEPGRRFLPDIESGNALILT